MSEAVAASIGAPRRTDPRSFAVAGIAMLGQLVLPLGFLAFSIFRDGEVFALAFFVPIVLALVAFNFAIAYAQWLRFTYTVNEADIRVESGLLSRTARAVPYERIQDVSLEQKPIPRLFGLTEVRFETGAGGKDEVTLRYLTEAEGERLRELVRVQKTGAMASDEAGAEREPPVLFAMGPKRVLTFGLFEFSLAVVAVVAGAVQQFDFLLDFDIWEWREWQRLLAGPGSWLLALGVVGQVIAGALAVTALLLIGLVTGVVRTVLREWNFRLERTEKGLRRRRGLLTRTDVVMPIHRVQALRIGTGIVRRLFGWHRLGVVSLAQDSGGANHAAAPFAQTGEIAPIVGETGFHLPARDMDWRKGSKRYRIDRVIIAALVLLPLSALAAIALDGPLWIAPLAILGLKAVAEFLRHRHAMNALDGDQLYARHGWLSPRMAISSRVKLQSVEIARGPIARRRGYATLHLGLAGGKMALPG
ncbi:MAG: PH domain-containing protein, partial [Erythrobacter sp.]|nr:PH domain-containing protein [Erythrobacter sp.]